MLDKDKLDKIIFFFLKLFGALLDLVQSCFGGEIFMSLKGVRQTYPIICTRINLN